MDRTETEAKIYGWINDINNAVMRIEGKADESLELLKGGNGYGVLERINKLSVDIEKHETWWHDYIATREKTCPISDQVAAIRIQIQDRTAEILAVQKERQATRTKIVIAVLAMIGMLFGGGGLVVIQKLLAGR